MPWPLPASLLTSQTTPCPPHPCSLARMFTQNHDIFREAFLELQRPGRVPLSVFGTLDFSTALISFNYLSVCLMTISPARLYTPSGLCAHLSVLSADSTYYINSPEFNE